MDGWMFALVISAGAAAVWIAAFQTGRRHGRQEEADRRAEEDMAALGDSLARIRAVTAAFRQAQPDTHVSVGGVRFTREES